MNDSLFQGIDDFILGKTEEFSLDRHATKGLPRVKSETLEISSMLWVNSRPLSRLHQVNLLMHAYSHYSNSIIPLSSHESPILCVLEFISWTDMHQRVYLR